MLAPDSSPRSGSSLVKQALYEIKEYYVQMMVGLDRDLQHESESASPIHFGMAVAYRKSKA